MEDGGWRMNIILFYFSILVPQQQQQPEEDLCNLETPRRVHCVTLTSMIATSSQGNQESVLTSESGSISVMKIRVQENGTIGN
jgi:hypothetical protein